MSVFDRYFRKHGHYPRIRVDNGVQRLTVEFARGYVRIATSSPYSGEVYLTANTVRALLKQRSRILELIKLQDRNFDVPRRVHEAHLEELQSQRELRAAKRARSFDLDAETRRQQQHQRWLRARERGQQRET